MGRGRDRRKKERKQRRAVEREAEKAEVSDLETWRARALEAEAARDAACLMAAKAHNSAVEQKMEARKSEATVQRLLQELAALTAERDKLNKHKWQAHSDAEHWRKEHDRRVELLRAWMQRAERLEAELEAERARRAPPPRAGSRSLCRDKKEERLLLLLIHPDKHDKSDRLREAATMFTSRVLQGR